jgi:hypothetical protein
MTSMPCGPPKPRKAVFDTQVRLRTTALTVDVRRDEVGVVHVEERAVEIDNERSAAQAAVREEGPQREDLPLLVEARLPLASGTGGGAPSTTCRCRGRARP